MEVSLCSCDQMLSLETPSPVFLLFPEGVDDAESSKRLIILDLSGNQVPFRSFVGATKSHLVRTKDTRITLESGNSKGFRNSVSKTRVEEQLFEQTRENTFKYPFLPLDGVLNSKIISVSLKCLQHVPRVLRQGWMPKLWGVHEGNERLWEEQGEGVSGVWTWYPHARVLIPTLPPLGCGPLVDYLISLLLSLPISNLSIVNNT